jgi:hypothetical protein
MRALDTRSPAQSHELASENSSPRIVSGHLAIARLAVDLRDFDYSQPAQVLWFTHFSQHGQINAGESRPFLEVTDAIRFIMEKLDGVNQAMASISLDNGSLTLTEITLLYARLGRGKRYPQLH